MAAAQQSRVHPELAAQLADVALGRKAAELAVRGGRVFCAFTREWLNVDVLVTQGHVASLVERGAAGPQLPEAQTTIDATGHYVVPGFIDAHLHIESSKLTPARFAETVLRHGTTAVVAEPHEVANVAGVPGVRWMMDACEALPLDVRFMVPSSVPASAFESAGAELGVEEMELLLQHPRMLGIGELMNFPAVLAGDPEVLARAAARGATHVDGHAPGLAGGELDAYVAAGVGSDHESTTVEEARAKLRRGMWVLLRDASNARNLEELLPLVQELGTDWCAFCTDDREPDELLRDGHINRMCRIAVARGLRAEDALVLGTINAAAAHGLHRHGAIAPGRRADLVLLDELVRFEPVCVVAGGDLVVQGRELLWSAAPDELAQSVVGTVRTGPVSVRDLQVTAPRVAADPAATTADVRVIGVQDGQLLTHALEARLPLVDGVVAADPSTDTASLAVIERHRASGRIGLGFVRGFGLRSGAIASTVAHDAHNLVVAGVDTASMLACVERLGELGGGIAVARDGVVLAELALPVAGLMSSAPAGQVAAALDEVHARVEELGGLLAAPFMALSFVALSVIPSLKLTDRGLVDVEAFELVPLAAAPAAVSPSL